MNCSLFYFVDPSNTDDIKFGPVLIDEEIATQNILPILIGPLQRLSFQILKDRATERNEAILERSSKLHKSLNKETNSICFIDTESLRRVVWLLTTSSLILVSLE